MYTILIFKFRTIYIYENNSWLETRRRKITPTIIIAETRREFYTMKILFVKTFTVFLFRLSFHKDAHATTEETWSLSPMQSRITTYPNNNLFSIISPSIQVHCFMWPSRSFNCVTLISLKQYALPLSRNLFHPLSHAEMASRAFISLL